MFRRNSVKLPNVAYKKMIYSSFAGGMNSDVDENLMPHKYAKLCYNYSVKDGKLGTGIGFDALSLPTTFLEGSEEREIYLPTGVKFKNVWHFHNYSQTNLRKEHLLVYHGDDNKLYWIKLVGIDPNSYYVDENTIYTGTPNAISYRLSDHDVIIFTSPSENMWVFSPDYDLTTISTAPKIVSMCLHYERLWAIVEGERNELRFSDDLDPTNWTTSSTEGGYIQMVDDRGQLQKVVSFNDYVYVVRDFGIARVSAYGEQDDFSVSQIYASSGKIYGNSVAVCGDRIMFLAKNGIHAFDGISAKKVDLNIDKLFEGEHNGNCCQAYFNNKYYLACRLNFGDDEQVGCESYANGYTNNALIELDLVDGGCNITRGIDIVSMTSVEEGYISKLVVCFGGEHAEKLGQMTNDGKLFGTAIKKVWVSPKSHLGYPFQKKIVKTIVVNSENDCKIKIETDDKAKTFDIKGKSLASKISPHMVGENIEISFITEGADANISAPQIVFGVVE